jgi:poly(A) polymerase Pap1
MSINGIRSCLQTPLSNNQKFKDITAKTKNEKPKMHTQQSFSSRNSSQQSTRTNNKKGNKRTNKRDFSTQRCIDEDVSEPESDTDKKKVLLKVVNNQQKSYMDLPDSNNMMKDSLINLKLKITGRQDYPENIYYTGENSYIPKQILIIAPLKVNIATNNQEYTLRLKLLSEIETRVIYLFDRILA